MHYVTKEFLMEGKRRVKKETRGFGSKHWISFQAWTLHWVFQQMSKSLLAVDRQPNGPLHTECGRAVGVGVGGDRNQRKIENKTPHATFFTIFKASLVKKDYTNSSACQDISHHLSLSHLAAPEVDFPFLCSSLLLRHGRNDSWIGEQPQPSLLSQTNIGDAKKCTKAWKMMVMSWRPPFGSNFQRINVLTWQKQARNWNITRMQATEILERAEEYNNKTCNGQSLKQISQTEMCETNNNKQKTATKTKQLVNHWKDYCILF